MAASYTPLQKALALEMVARYGGGITGECLAAIREALQRPDLNKSSLWRWLQATPPAAVQPVAESVQPIKKAAAEALDAFFERTAHAYLQHANLPEVIAETKGPQAVTAAAIAVDKMRLLRDLPTEIVTLLPGVLRALDQLQIRPADVFQSIIEEAAAQHGASDD